MDRKIVTCFKDWRDWNKILNLIRANAGLPKRPASDNPYKEDTLKYHNEKIEEAYRLNRKNYVSYHLDKITEVENET